MSRTKFTDVTVGAVIFVCALFIFWFSPVHQVTDSKYSMLLSEALIRYRSFALDHFAIPRLEPVQRTDYVMDGGIYQLEIVGDRIYYFFPPGSSVLSTPYVVLANLLGVSAANGDRSFNLLGEIKIQLGLAALLMAILSSLFFFTARLLLPPLWSAVVAVGGSLGTQIWSTASRGLWSHTWSVLLTGIVVYLLLRTEIKKERMRPILLATLLSWMYFVRPGNSVQVICVTIYVALHYRKALIPYLTTGALWLAAFVSYSYYHFRALMPNYYRASRLEFGIFPVSFPGHLISPSRGLFVYVPILLFIVYLLVRYWRYKRVSRLTWLAIALSVSNLLVISCFVHWWGGASFGPRFTTDVVPWFVLLGAVAIDAMRNAHAAGIQRKTVWAAELSAGALLLAASIFINARGALALETWRWNPADVSQVGTKLWDWRQAQFLAGLVPPPLDHDYSSLPVGHRIDFTKPGESDRYVWYGWSNSEPTFRWNDGRESTLIFATDEKTDLRLKIKLLPFVREDVWPRQRIVATLNGTVIDSIVLTQNQDTELSIALPGYLLRPRNVLKFTAPDAASPELLRISSDQRQLGFAIYWIELEKDNH